MSVSWGVCKRCGTAVKFPIMLHSACFETEVSGIVEQICDKYCRFPLECKCQDELDVHCDECVLTELLMNIGKKTSNAKSGSKEKPMTNFENITQSPEYLAYVITSLIHDVEMSCVRRMEDAGVKCDLYGLDTDLQAQVHLAWLESEVETE